LGHQHIDCGAERLHENVVRRVARLQRRGVEQLRPSKEEAEVARRAGRSFLGDGVRAAVDGRGWRFELGRRMPPFALPNASRTIGSAAAGSGPSSMAGDCGGAAPSRTHRVNALSAAFTTA